MSSYLPSPSLSTFAQLALARMRRGHGAVLLLEGPPGAGKTAFARYLAAELHAAPLHYYAGAPDRERDLLMEIDVHGVLRRESAWVPGPAWQAFDDSQHGPTVLLLDEVDKTAPGFDAFLLRLLEDFEFRGPRGDTITARPENLLVVMTSNGRRDLRPEVLRRTQRVPVPLPDRQREAAIIQQLAGRPLPAGLLDVLQRIAAALRKQGSDQAPSPKEIALCACDLLELDRLGADSDSWRQVPTSWLVKEGGVAVLDATLPEFRWARALRTEARAR